MGSISIRKTILVIGRLDTKGGECLYIKKLAQENGFDAFIIDCGDITRRKVAFRAGASPSSPHP
jgi:uncharacterized protein (UPF0261 family)